MSSTRKAESGKPFRQERYCSSGELDRGLMANLVAGRCDALDRAEDRELIYFLQLLSHREGGMKKVAADLLAQFPERIGTRSMLKSGVKPGKNYTAEQVCQIRGQLPLTLRSPFMLKGETDSGDELLSVLSDGRYSKSERQLRREAYAALVFDPDAEERAGHRAGAEADARPNSIPVESFREACIQAASEHLESDLKKLCLDPAEKFDGHSVWYFHELIPCLRQFQNNWIAQRSAGTVVTRLGWMVYDTLDFTLETKCLTLIDGIARTGKTFSAKAWCELHPGRARYVQVPSTNDDIGFFRAIAKSLGVSINLNSKAQELRQRIEEVLQRGDLLLCLDESHYLWPNTNLRDAVPTRLTWIMTALVNFGVPVSLVTTPQFLRTQKAVERKSCWTSEQFVGRIGHYQNLPDSLSEADLNSVAASLLPEGDARALEILVRYAQGSAKYLAGIESVVRRARYLAGKECRGKVSNADIKRAIKSSVIPSDSALAQAIAEPEKPSRRRVTSDLKRALIQPLRPVMDGDVTDGKTQNFAERRPCFVADLDRSESGRAACALVPA